jgi:rhamnosyltransferase
MSKKVAVIGARGISNWGGFETAAREIAPRLVERGYDVYCSCEKNSCDLDTYKGVQMVYFPFRMPQNYELRKIFEVLYDLYFIIISSTMLDCEVVYSLGYNANILMSVPRLLGKKVMFNMAGLEWERSKFSRVQQFIIKSLYLLATVGTSHIIIDHEKLKPYVPSRFHDKVVFLTYGANEPIAAPWNVGTIAEASKSTEVERLLPHKYWLVIARLEPDQHIVTIVNAYLHGTSTKPLVIVGDFSSKKYEQAVTEALSDAPPGKEVILTGGIYGQPALTMLRHNCCAYIHGHSKGGTNPSLLEAMIHKNIIIAHDNKFNRGVCEDVALYFKGAEDLQRHMRAIDDDPLKYTLLKDKVYERVTAEYSWESVADQHDSFFKALFRDETEGFPRTIDTSIQQSDSR